MFRKVKPGIHAGREQIAPSSIAVPATLITAPALCTPR